MCVCVKKFISFLLFFGAAFSGCSGLKQNYNSSHFLNEEIQESADYIGEYRELYLSMKEHIDSPLLAKLFNDPRFKIYERSHNRKKNYDKITVDFYKRPQFGFFTKAGVKAGREFAEKNIEALKKAIDMYKLPEKAVWDISALAGIEYSWGRLKTPYHAFNALVSLYRDVPTHKDFALKNIKGLIDGIDDPFIKIDPYAPSSFTGAVGCCQLMPFWLSKISEYRKKDRFDVNKDGVFDPFDMDDAIGFFAWRLKEQGYLKNRFNAIKRYNGSGAAATAFAQAIIEYVSLIEN